MMAGNLQRCMLLSNFTGAAGTRAGMLFEYEDLGICLSIEDKVNMNSCEDTTKNIINCPLRCLRLLTNEEYNILHAIRSPDHRVAVCCPSSGDGKSKLQQGLEAKMGNAVEVYDSSLKVKTGIGFIKSIGSHCGGGHRYIFPGTYFGVVLSDHNFHPETDKQPKFVQVPLHRLNFILPDAKRKESCLTVEKERLLRQQEEIWRDIQAKKSTAAQHPRLLPVPAASVSASLLGRLRTSIADAPILAPVPPISPSPVASGACRRALPVTVTDPIPAPVFNSSLSAPAPIPSPRPAPAPVRRIPPEVAELCECPICLNMFQSPKSLQCEHHFCKDCLEELVKFDEKKLPFIKCPVCNATHEFKDPDATPDSLKCQLFVKQILDRYSDNHASDDGPKCCDKPVHWYCGDCAKHLCDECYQLGCVFCKNTTAVRYSRSKEAILPYCTTHNMLQSVACTPCSGALCPYCAQTHEENHLVVPIAAHADKYKQYLQCQIEGAKERKDKVERFLHDDVNAAKQAVIQRANDIIARVRVMENALLKKAELMHHEQRRGLEEAVRENEDLIKKAGLLQQQGNVGVIWGTQNIVEMVHACSESGETSERPASKPEDGEDFQLESLCDYFQDLRYPCMDRSGNVIEQTLDFGSLSKKLDARVSK